MTLQNPFKIIAHRGGAGLRLENSMSAFRNALSLPIDGIEFDVHLTKDNRAIVYHDFTINPDLTYRTDGKLFTHQSFPIENLTFTEVHDFLLKTDPAEPIPSLHTVLTYIKAHAPHCEIFLEMKTKEFKDDTFLKSILKDIEETGTEDKVRVLCFEWSTLKHLGRINPNIPLIFAVDDQMHQLNDFLPLIKKDGGWAWSTHYKNLTADLVHKAHDLNLHVNAWTPNAENEMERLIGLKVDSITTDRPDLLISYKMSLAVIYEKTEALEDPHLP